MKVNLFRTKEKVKIKKYVLTSRERAKLQKEFDRLFDKQKKFREAYIRAVQEGDERENDGWYVTHDLNEQNIQRLSELDMILKNCEVVEEDHDDKRVSLGDNVTLKINDGKATEYEFLSYVGVAKSSNVITPESPIGRLILGARVNEVVTTFNDSREIKVEIVSVS